MQRKLVVRRDEEADIAEAEVALSLSRPTAAS